MSIQQYCLFYNFFGGFVKRYSYLLLLAAFSVILLNSCNKLEDKKAENEPVVTTEVVKNFATAEEMVADAKLRIKEISKDELKAKMESGAKFYLIDVREPDEWEAGHFDKAVRVGRGILEFKLKKIIPEITKEDEIVLYCKKGDRSTLAADALVKLGFKNVAALEGGWDGYNGIAAEAKPAGEAKPKEAKASGGGC